MGKRLSRRNDKVRLFNEMGVAKSFSFLLVILCLSSISCSFIFPSKSHAWWSETKTQHILSTHDRIGKKAEELITLRNQFLQDNIDEILSYTYRANNDQDAHGGDGTRNGGNIETYYRAALIAYQNYLNTGDDNNKRAAMQWLGWCIHLIEDMAVPAHAFNIKHANADLFDSCPFNMEICDNFEIVGEEIFAESDPFSSLSSITEFDKSGKPTKFYDEARQNTIDFVENGLGNYFSSYWLEGHGDPWCGDNTPTAGCTDGPMGSYGGEEEKDKFPISYVSADGLEGFIVFYQLRQAVRYVGMFLLSVDRILSVNPVISQNPPSGSPGTTFYESGSGFMPNSTATLHFLKPDASEYPTQTVSLDVNGSFSITYTPSCNKAPGTYTWWAIDNSTGKKSNEVSYEITSSFGPNIGQTPVAGPPGTTFDEWGCGFTPDHDATLHFLKPDGTEYPTRTVHTNSAGYFSLSYTAPDDKPEGTYTWWAIDDHTGVSSNSVSYQITNDDPGTVYIQGHTVLVNETWHSGGTYIVQGNVTVAQDATLTIQPGAIVKLNAGVQISVYGTLHAVGTSSSKIKFTWADGQNQWNGIVFSGAGSSGSRIENSIIEHAHGYFMGCGSYCATYFGAVTILNSSPTITGTTIHQSSAPAGIWMHNASPMITGNTIEGFVIGIQIDDWYNYSTAGSFPTVTGNYILNNTTGISFGDMTNPVFHTNHLAGNIFYGLYYTGSTVIDATNCNWGDPSGPLDDSDDRATGGLYNPNGLGNRVSDHVNYYPWVGSTAPQSPTGLAGTPEDSAINLTWNAVTDSSLDGYKIYFGTSSGNYGAPVKVGNVTAHQLTQLTNGTPYYIAISSVNTFGTESAKCTEIMVTPNSDTDKPTSTITQPLNGSNIFTNKYLIKGTADDGTGSGVQKVEVSTDGGSTWNQTTGTISWSHTWTIPGTGTYNIKSRATDNANNEETPSAGITVTVVNRQPTPVTVNGRKLMVNGNPFTVKGVGYSPVPIGIDPETTSPYGDYFTSDYNSIYDRDLPLLGDMGTNTIHLWSWNNIGDHLDFLDKAYNGGVAPIYVIAGFWINPDLNIDPNSPDNVRENLKADFREMVAVHKNHPAILMWAIGNELNSPLMYGSKLNDIFSLINEMAAEAHQEEGTNYHPVTTSLYDSDLVSTISTYDSLVPSLDIWSANIYRGNTFGTLFNDYKALSQKPLAILEYGIDAFDNDHGNEYEKIGTPYQADYTEALWKEIAANSDTCVGGSIMAYSDEWYKGEYSTDPGCPDNDPAYHSTCGYPASSHPDGYCNEEWLGIMRTVDNGNNPDIMEPRAAYYRLQALWVPSPSISISPTSKDFGNINVNNTSTPQTFTISNTGTANLNIGTITTTNPVEFRIQNDNCSAHTISPSGTCTVQVVFSPASLGSKTANLSIPSNDPHKNPLDVPLSGSGSATLNVSINPAAGGTATGVNINCPGDCIETYTASTTVTLVANPNAGYSFNKWTGCNATSGNQCTVVMSANRNVTARFTLVTTLLPDLTGAWSNVSKTGSTKRGQYTVSGNLTISNIGTAVATAVVVNIYLSNDNIFGAGDTLIQSDTYQNIQPGAQKVFGVSYKSSTDPGGKYLIGVIDPSNTVNESNENNNISNAVIP